jgi:xanthine dehydrogenase YagS FAD-binding subunit
MAVALRALDAVVEVISAKGAARMIPIADFHRLPGDTPHLETNLAPDEMITAVILPAPVGGMHVYRKVRERASYAFANVSVAMILADGRARRLALGGLAHKPWRVEAAEEAPPEGIADIVLAGAKPTADNAYKLDLTRRTIAACFGDAS